MATLKAIKQQLQEQIHCCYNKLIPFDKVFDEDFLHAKQEQLSIIAEEIQLLQMKLIVHICRTEKAGVHESPNEDPEYEMIHEKLVLFEERYQEVTTNIRNIHIFRKTKYDIWKSEYIRMTREIAGYKEELAKFENIEKVLAAACLCAKAPRHNLIHLIFLHTQTNYLLALAGCKKESVAFTAFKSAYYNGLISRDTFNRLVRRN
jgi:hypothetical protein